MTAWYEQLRSQYRPARLEVLLIGDSPPGPAAGERRFFYAPTLRIDNLYRGVAQGLYGNHPEVDLADKPAVLRRLQADGFWLIEAVDPPINHPRNSIAVARHLPHRQVSGRGPPPHFNKTGDNFAWPQD